MDDNKINPEILPRAVEAAARANHGRTREGEFRWDLEVEGVKQGLREFFRPFITAALAEVEADIRAGAWDEGYTSGHSNAMRRMSDEPNAPTTPNPYRIEQEGKA